MQTGDIVIIAFPFVDLINFKARPAVVVTHTPDSFQDIIGCFITSVLPTFEHFLHISLTPPSINNLKVPSTIEAEKIQKVIGKLSDTERNFLQKNSGN